MDPRALLDALGGAGNVRKIEARSSRLLLDVASVDAFDEMALARLGVRAWVRIAPTIAHVILGPAAEAAAPAIKSLMAADRLTDAPA